MPRVTIADVAMRAGVSKTAVSFAFNNPERLGQATLERVLGVAHDLGYTPHPAARALSTSNRPRRIVRYICHKPAATDPGVAAERPPVTRFMRRFWIGSPNRSSKCGMMPTLSYIVIIVTSWPRPLSPRAS